MPISWSSPAPLKRFEENKSSLFSKGTFVRSSLLLLFFPFTMPVLFKLVSELACSGLELGHVELVNGSATERVGGLQLLLEAGRALEQPLDPDVLLKALAVGLSGLLVLPIARPVFAQLSPPLWLFFQERAFQRSAARQPFSIELAL